MAVAGLSTIGVKVGYALETAAGTQPTKFTNLTRINAIGGINLEPEQIDASALIDTITQYIAGRSDPGGTFPITINLTSETEAEWTALISAFTGRTNKSLRMWWVVYHPSLTKSFFIVAEPPSNIPLPEIGQNELLTAEMSLTINEYKGMMTAVEPTDKE